MRYDTPVKFVAEQEPVYDETTGNYTDPELAVQTILASVMDAGTDTMHLVYGSIKQGSKTIHIQNHLDKSFDYLIIGDTRYNIDMYRRLRNKDAFVVSEVQ